MKNSISKFITCLKLLVGVSFVTGQTLVPATNNNIQYMGRIDFSNPQQPTYIYPGVSIKAKFNGTKIIAKIHDYGDGSDARGNFYKIFIDGQIVIEQLKVSNGAFNYLLASDLSASDHTVEVIKITEGASGKSSFKGFIITGGTEALVSQDIASEKKIEFIGDSWTCGFGNLSQFSTGSASMAFSNYFAKNEDNYYSWGAITARTLGAQYHVTATSGRGLYRNNTGSMNNTLPKNYDNLFEDDPSVSWIHNNYHPDLISIHLGTNDLAQEESGQAYKLDDEAFKQTYIKFIATLLSYHPCSNIIICFGNSKSDSWPTWTKQLSRLRTIANDVMANFNSNVTTLELSTTAEKWTGNPADDCGYGDAWHPSKCSHKEMATKLIQKINAMNINWGNTSCSLSSIKSISNKNINIYPNPVENQLTVNDIGLNTNWTIYNCMGQYKLKGVGNYIDVSSLAPGLYYFKAHKLSFTSSPLFIKE